MAVAVPPAPALAVHGRCCMGMSSSQQAMHGWAWVCCIPPTTAALMLLLMLMMLVAAWTATDPWWTWVVPLPSMLFVVGCCGWMTRMTS